MRAFDDIEAFAACTDLDSNVPYIIKTCSSLNDLYDQQAVKSIFGVFRSQLPSSEQAQRKRKAQIPFQHSSADAVRSAMLELAPKSRVPLTPTPVVSVWGCMTDMLAPGLEHMYLGSLRFTGRGVREIACMPSASVLTLASDIAKDSGKALPEYSEKNTLQDTIEKTIMDGMSDVVLNKAEEARLKAYRCTAGPGSLLFIPAGFAIVERALGAEVVTGFRTSCIENPNVMGTLEPLCDILRKYTDEKNAVLQGIASVEASLQRTGMQKK